MSQVSTRAIVFITAVIMIGSLGIAPLITNEAFAAGLTLSPSSGQVGTVVTLSGSGYTGSKTISATFGGAAITVSPANVKTTSAGAIPAGVTVTIPTATAGAKTIVVNAASSSGSAIFTLTNTAPTAGAKTASTNENAQVAITLTGTDANNDALSFAVATQPSHGTALIAGNSATYTPQTGYQGSDSFTYTANDGTASSSPATVSITVTDNTVPTADAKSVTTTENTAVDVTLTGSDTDNDALTFAVAIQPAHGTASVSGATATYTPSTGYQGADSFTYTATDDGSNTSTPATVSVTVNPATPPAAPTITVNGADIDNNAAAVDGMYTVLSQNGAVVATGFTPATFDVNANQQYTVSVGDYGTNYFDHWHNAATGQDTTTRDITVTSTSSGQLALTAVFRHTAAPGGSSVTVNAVDTDGAAVDGMFTTITATADNTQRTGFTTVNFPTTSGQEYTVSVGDFGTNYFDHWHNAATGQDTATRSITVTAASDSLQLTAVYRHTAAPAGSSITVSGADIDNNAVAINGMYTTITASADNTVRSGFTTVNFPTTSGQEYTVSVGDFGTNYFDHWQTSTGSVATRAITVTATDADQSLTAVFRHTPEPSGSSITVNAIDQNGNAVNGMFTTITATADNTQRTGFTTVNFPTTSGQEYTVAISDFGAYTFDHWQIGPNSDTNRFHSETAINGNTQLTAVFTQASSTP